MTSLILSRDPQIYQYLIFRFLKIKIYLMRKGYKLRRLLRDHKRKEVNNSTDSYHLIDRLMKPFPRNNRPSNG